ncbi:MAG TPA: thiamine biosynthesis protein [Nitrosopumilaceae archaeon]|nr:thiamine biosynthesis protein [Nitrosopumilaceae archaeon]
MNENVVVVFPSLYSLNKIDYLVSSISMILKTMKLGFSKIRKNGSVIIVEADDPVFASSAIASLFGIEKIAIAKEVENSFNSIVTTIVTVGANLLLRGERFFVKVDGTGTEYVPKDVELAATSALIEKTVNFQTKPGTESSYDKIIYTYITKSQAYVCVFIDKGAGGIPNKSQNQKVLCCIYDELSVIACLQTLKMGFDVKILVCYSNESELLNTVKMLNQILPKLLQTNVELHFCKLDMKSTGRSILLKTAIITAILVSFAKRIRIDRISLAISPLIFPAWFIEYNAMRVFQKGIIPWFPLSGIDNSIFDTANEIGLEKHVSKIVNLCKIKFKKDLPKDKINKISLISLRDIKTITITLGPKNIHDIIDSLKSNH